MQDYPLDLSPRQQGACYVNEHVFCCQGPGNLSYYPEKIIKRDPHKEDVLVVRHNRRGEVSPYWLAILLADVQVKANGGDFVRDKVPLRWFNQTEDTLTYTSGDVW